MASDGRTDPWTDKCIELIPISPSSDLEGGKNNLPLISGNQHPYPISKLISNNESMSNLKNRIMVFTNLKNKKCLFSNLKKGQSQ